MMRFDAMAPVRPFVMEIPILRAIGFGVGLLVMSSQILAATGVELRTPGTPPVVLERVEATDRLSAFAISADGTQAALATATDEKGRLSEIRLFSTERAQPLVTTVHGHVRDLLFATDASVLYGILHRSTKRTGDTHLMLIDLSTLKVKRANRLPVGATDLDHWISARALLIAAPSEIRSLLLPALRSGPLFPVTGANRSIASLGGGSLVLVGQENGFDLIDLEDRPGIEAMPVREHLDTADLVSGIAAAPSGQSALARLANGDLLTVEFGPLRSRPSGTGTAVAAPPVATVIRATELRAQVKPPPPKPSLPERRSHDRTKDRAEIEPPSNPPTEAVPEAAPSSKPASPASTAPPTPAVEVKLEPPAPAPAPGQPAPEAAPPAPAEPIEADERKPLQTGETSAEATAPKPPLPKTDAPKAVPAPARTAPTTTPSTPPRPEVPPVTPAPTRTAQLDSDAQLSGRVVGAAAPLVRFIVLKGPDNILREAARIALNSNGMYRINGLASGRYRVQIDGGGGKVIASRPPYVIVEIKDGEQVQALDIEALREL